jgi:hypothetical protein
MSCNCGKPARQFEHVGPDGKVTVVQSQQEAVQLTRKNGGTWRIKR